MSTPAKAVIRGFYVDYTRNWGFRKLINDLSSLATHHDTETQYLASNAKATLWTNALGTVVAVTIARLFRLLLRLYAIKRESLATPHKTPEAILWHRLLDWHLERQEGTIALPGTQDGHEQQQINNESEYMQTRSCRVKSRAPLSVPLKVLVLAIFYFGILACSTFTAQLATNSHSLSNSPVCGLYPGPGKTFDLASYIRVDWNAEYESAALAENCFGADDGADGCNHFLLESVSYRESKAVCPYPDRYMCWQGDQELIHLSTGSVDAKEIGIDTPEMMQYSRETTCAPVTSNNSFVEGFKHTCSAYHVYSYGEYRGDPYTLNEDDANLYCGSPYTVR